MSYTFWHCGILIGESEMEEAPDCPAQRGGIFHPTIYGSAVFPRLTGILTAGHALKQQLDARGLVAEELEPEQVEDIFETTPAGQKIIDIGRTLCEVEVRSPDGAPLEFKSIAFSDLREIRRLGRELSLDADWELDELPPDTPYYIVSATFGSAPDERDVPADVPFIRRSGPERDN